MDVLTDVLGTMRVSSMLYARIEATAPWGVGFEVKHVVKFCLVARGGCCLTMEGSGPLFLSEGDFFLTSRARYCVCDSPGSPVRPVEEILSQAEGRTGQSVGKPVHIGGPGPATTLLNGLLSFEGPDQAYFLDLLPRLIIVRREQALRWGFEVYLQRLSIEAQDPTPGAQLVANWLGGILFVHSVRGYAGSEEGRQPGWLGALSDRRIAAGLHAMHERVDHRWTVGELAKVAGMSRSGFAQSFRERVGKSPLEYLSDWRMHLAQRFLQQEGQKLSWIASRLGYDSDTAFSKAFKARTGTTPSEYRKQGKLVSPAGDRSRP